MKKAIFALALIGSVWAFAQENSNPPAQGPPQQGEQRHGGLRASPGVDGTIQSISGDTLTLSTGNGVTASVKTTPDTRLLHEGQSATKLSDFKVGDRVIVFGESTGENSWTARALISRRGPGEGQGQGQGGGQGGGAMMERMREGLGKEFVAGEVKSIDGTTLVVHGPDGKDYSAQVDENTSFRRGRDSNPFPEIKVGDRVMGRGKVNATGVFVFENLNVGGFGGGRSRGREGAQPPKQ